MGALANAAALRVEPVFKDWVETACAYVARLVLMEATTTTDHAFRVRLAREVAVTPSMISPIVMTAVATDPEVATKGSTAAVIGEQMVIDKVQAVWTTIAKLYFPNEVV